jgi:flagellar hook-basal body complex protein FliE
MADFAAGGSADLHTVMLQMQEASIGLKTGIAVRDRLLEAYQEIMRLSI